MSSLTIDFPTISKYTELIGLTLGPAILAFNLFNFTLGGSGYYYKDPAQYGIALGVFLTAIGLVIKRFRL